MKKILIIGATSAIAEATARLFARRGDSLFLLARDPGHLADIAGDLKIRGAAKVGFRALDVNDFGLYEECLNEACNSLGRVDVALLAHGVLPDQHACEEDFNLTLEVLKTNALSTISLLTLIANKMSAQKGGAIAVITSVAGDRGRQSNYVYGTSKGMVSIFLQGLRNRLFRSGVKVLDIKPGFVDTPMTAEFRKGLLWARPEKVASDIFRAIEKGKDEIYTPGFWRLVMLIARNIPETLFKRLKL